MGKKQHQKDKLYLTSSEWRDLYGGCKQTAETSVYRSKFKRLPFDHCSLSLQPFKDPVCTPEGVIFDIVSIVPYLKEYGRNPVSGEKMTAKQLVKLKFHKNASGEFHCPVTYRSFTNTTYIVAVKTTGHVYAYEAVDELNFKAKNFRDLLTDEPFKRTDVIDIQNPQKLDKFNIATFYHVIQKEKEGRTEEEPTSSINSMNYATRETLTQLKREYKPSGSILSRPDLNDSELPDDLSAANFSTGAVAAGFTSTVMEPRTSQQAAKIDEDVLRYERVKKKGYIRLMTSLGQLNLELHCDMVPRTCENFVKLCQRGYYTDTIFHRCIKYFMIQGGDPTGTGNGGESAFGEPIKDEFKPNLKHIGQGILSMANSGPDTNKSQFFITFRACKHLDNKHTVFGRVVGGLETVLKMEKAETDDKDRPVEEIKILGCQVFTDPFTEADEKLAEDRAKLKEDSKLAAEEAAAAKIAAKRPNPLQKQAASSGVGRYLPAGVSKTVTENTTTTKAVEPVSKKNKIVRSKFDFSGW